MHLLTRTPSMLSLCMGLGTRFDCPHVLPSMDSLAQGWHPRTRGAHTRVQHRQSTLARCHLRGCGRAWKSW